MVSGDFGFHYAHEDVKLCRIFLENWHVPPNETLNTPRELLFDILRDVNLRDSVERAIEKGSCQVVEEVREYLDTYTKGDEYEEQITELKPIRF